MISELDEGEREEFYRLKKVQAKKKRDIAKREADIAERLMVAPVKAQTNLLEEKEDDLLFN